MHLLSRHVLTELTKVFLIALSALTLMMIIAGVVREAMMQSLPPAQVLQLIPYVLPDALRIAVPVTLLLATTFVYGRMSGNNEIVAAKALGIHPWKLLGPTFIFAFLLSLVTVWLNDLAVSWGRNGVQQVVIDSVEDIVYGVLEVQRSYESDNVSIHVQRVEDRKLILPTVRIEGRGDSPTRTVYADEAVLETDRSADVLRVKLYNATVDIGPLTMRSRGLFRPIPEIPLQEASRARRAARLPSWLSLRVIGPEKIKQKEVIRRIDADHAARAAYQMLCGDFEALTDSAWENRAQERSRARDRLRRLNLEPHRRWSAGFSCLCFVWVGAPMAIRRRKSDFLAVFFLCFLPILIAYYPLLIYGIDGAKNGTIPPYSVWAGNLLLLAWGTWLLKRVVRY